MSEGQLTLCKRYHANKLANILKTASNLLVNIMIIKYDSIVANIVQLTECSEASSAFCYVILKLASKWWSESHFYTRMDVRRRKKKSCWIVELGDVRESKRFPIKTDLCCSFALITSSAASLRNKQHSPAWAQSDPCQMMKEAVRGPDSVCVRACARLNVCYRRGAT